jgi:WD40 repeat protein
MKMQKKLLILGIAMLVSFASPMVLSGMEVEEPEDELTMYFKQLPQELQQDIRRLQLMKDPVLFFGLHDQKPITLDCGDNVRSVAINHDIILTGGDAGTDTWDINNGKSLGHDSLPCYRVAISDNNIMVILPSHDVVVNNIKVTLPTGDVKVWNRETGKELGGLAWFDSVAINNNYLVTANNEITAICDMKTGKLLHTLEGSSPVAISGDIVVTGPGKAIGAGKTNVKVWDINSGQLIHILNHGDLIKSVAISGNNMVTLSLGAKHVRVWDISEGKQLRVLKSTDQIQSVAVHGDIVITGLFNGTAKVWNINNGQLIYTLKGHTKPIESVAISNKKIVTGSNDKTAKIWSLSINLQDTSETNPLIWIIQKASIPQLDLIKRAHEATVDWVGYSFRTYPNVTFPQSGFPIVIPSEDAKVFLSFPMHVRRYLLDRLDIELKVR